jgi:hypothetical protein
MATPRILGICAVITVTLAACNLPFAWIGGFCFADEDYAQNGTHVLQCENGKWIPGLTVDEADGFMQSAWGIAPTHTPSPKIVDGFYEVVPVPAAQNQFFPGVAVRVTPGTTVAELAPIILLAQQRYISIVHPGRTWSSFQTGGKSGIVGQAIGETALFLTFLPPLNDVDWWVFNTQQVLQLSDVQFAFLYDVVTG